MFQFGDNKFMKFKIQFPCNITSVSATITNDNVALNIPLLLIKTIKKANKKNFMAPFYGWGSTASRLQPLRGGSLLFTIQFPGIPGTHFIDLRRMKG